MVYSHYDQRSLHSEMPTCVSCSFFSANKRAFHLFTCKPHLRDQWLEALTENDNDKAKLDIHLRNATVRQYVCTTHFYPASFTETPYSRSLNPDAVPISIVSNTSLLRKKSLSKVHQK